MTKGEENDMNVWFLEKVVKEVRLRYIRENILKVTVKIGKNCKMCKVKVDKRK